MSIITREVKNIQNPALGAVLLWRYACGYCESHPTKSPVPFPLLFIVLPVIFHQKTEDFIAHTNKSSGLRKFAAKFGSSQNCKEDLLLLIHNNALSLRKLSMDSFRIALASNLLFLKTSEVIPLTKTIPKAGIAADIYRLMVSADKLGYWCGSLTLHEIATTLKVRF